MSGVSGAICSGLKRKFEYFQGYFGGEASNKKANLQEDNILNCFSSEIFLKIFLYAIKTPKDVGNLAHVCQKFNSLINKTLSEYIWQDESKIKGFARFIDCTWKKSYYLNSKISSIIFSFVDNGLIAPKDKYKLVKTLVQLKDIERVKPLIESFGIDDDEDEDDETFYKVLSQIELLKIEHGESEILKTKAIIDKLYYPDDRALAQIEFMKIFPEESEIDFPEEMVGMNDHVVYNTIRLQLIKALLQLGKIEKAKDIMKNIYDEEIKILAKIELMKVEPVLNEIDEIKDLIDEKTIDEKEKNHLKITYVSFLVDLLLKERPYEMECLKERAQNTINEIKDIYYKAHAQIQYLRAYPDEIKKTKKLINRIKPRFYDSWSEMLEDQLSYSSSSRKYCRVMIELSNVKLDESKNAGKILLNKQVRFKNDKIPKKFVKNLIRADRIKEAKNYIKNVHNKHKEDVPKLLECDISAQLKILKLIMQHRF